MFSIFRRKKPDRAYVKIKSALEAIDQNNPSDNDLLITAIFAAADMLFWDHFDRHPKLKAKFMSDGVCFELAAYIFYRIDLYAYSLNPLWREKVIPQLHKQIERLFRDPLGFNSESFAEILNNRFQIHGHFVRDANTNSDVIEILLLRFIYDTSAHNGIPQFGLDHHKPFEQDNIADLLCGLIQTWHSYSLDSAHYVVKELHQKK